MYYVFVLKVCWNSEKKDATLYTEKYQHVRFACSVKQFGGRPSIGALLLTSTGMLASIMLPHHTYQAAPIVTTESLSASRNLISTVDICYGKSKTRISLNFLIDKNVNFF